MAERGKTRRTWMEEALYLEAPVSCHGFISGLCKTRNTLTIITLQNVNRAVEFIDWLGLAKAQSIVDTMIIINSIPYIFFRPSVSAMKPNMIWPRMMPALVEALSA